MVELRKRKTPPPAPVRPAKKKAAPKAEKTKVSKGKAAVTEKVVEIKEAVTGKINGEKAANPASGPPKVGDTIDLVDFGGEILTNDVTKTTLAKLVEESKGGVVLFTYPKASTPGCTKQACLFRDSYEPLTATGLSIYGLSSDSPKANTTFKTKQNLPYPLLCDPSQTLISAIGLKKAPKGITRGVFVIDKAGKVLVAEAGSPDGTVAVVKKIVASSEGAPALAAQGAKDKEDVAMAQTASEVADTAAKVDNEA
ncbi:AhpC-TSA-domain-containing protein [Lindgomyces ingoldianus]|uniref:AhpC-TSA-domain-containing protein n=1 Tax=Lindgomyces ingoldianus TaxID=673940 RepID=A0ACB6QJA0_9PLEO|nr:AhpC-TSA-domain-containing protein [Lindgomyces ingoldianus]KAF2467034.1 AhpC-TSA-domain-containing protein [Lindgomyces ingoldianus]